MEHQCNTHKQTAILSIINFFNKESEEYQSNRIIQQTFRDMSSNLAKIYSLRERDHWRYSKIDFMEEIKYAEEQMWKKHRTNLADFYRYVGNCAMEQHNFLAAIDHFSASMIYQQNDPLLYCNRSEALCYNRNFLESYNDASYAINLNPQYARAYNRLGITCANMGKWDEALVAFENAVRTEIKDNHIYYQNFINCQEQIRAINSNKVQNFQNRNHRLDSNLYAPGHSSRIIHYFAMNANRHLRISRSLPQGGFYISSPFMNQNQQPYMNNPQVPPVHIDIVYTSLNSPPTNHKEVFSFTVPEDPDEDLDKSGPYFF